MSENLIEEFVDKSSKNALKTLLDSNSNDEVKKAGLQISSILGAADLFKNVIKENAENETKLISSFRKNLVLLIQKTWIEKSDEELKAQVLYQLEEFCSNLNAHEYVQSASQFFSIVDNVVYLMFGNQTKAKDFLEYAFRIDPEFGVFWWYIKSLPRDVEWPQNKARILVLLGMCFLANY